VTFQDYFIDTPIILETVKDQFYRLGKEFIGPMAELRGLVRRAMGVCQLWEKRNRDNTGLSKEKDEWSRISGNLRGEWNSLYVEAKVILETITKLLEKEGATPEK
jgi:hypothetical protein